MCVHAQSLYYREVCCMNMRNSWHRDVRVYTACQYSAHCLSLWWVGDYLWLHPICLYTCSLNDTLQCCVQAKLPLCLYRSHDVSHDKVLCTWELLYINYLLHTMYRYHMICHQKLFCKWHLACVWYMCSWFTLHRKSAHDFGRDLKDLVTLKFDLGASIRSSTAQ